MNRKKIPPRNKHKGLFVYCSKCKSHFSWTHKKIKNEQANLVNIEPNCKDSGKQLSKCKFQSKHYYKSRLHMPGDNKRIVSKTFDVSKYNDAIVLAIEFENHIKNSHHEYDIKESKNTRHYLFDTEIKYLDFLDNVNVPAHQKVKRSEKHLKEIQKTLQLFNESLNKFKINKKLITIEKISDKHVGHFHDYLLNDKNYSNKTYNNKMGLLRSFIKWAIDEFEIKMKNPFEKAKNRSVVLNKDTITKKEFSDLLSIISPEKGWAASGKTQEKMRSWYRPYLKDALELALHTGGRREEVVNIKWDMIKTIDGELAYIVVKNLKVERKLGEGFNDNVAPKIIPITKSLKKLLYRIGYEKNKSMSTYLIQPNRKGVSSKSIMENLSRGFNHYYKQLNTGKNLQLKSLRKTYLTYLNSVLSGDTKSLSSHSTDDVLIKHYIDEKVINKAIKEVEIFG